MKTETKQFEADYLVLQPAMQRMAERLLGNEDEAADVVQDCFVTLWSERESLKRVLNREAWCITLVKRRCVDLMRRRHPSVGADYLADLARISPTATNCSSWPSHSLADCLSVSKKCCK